MGIPILYGRSFTRLDRAESQPVAVVNQRFVREFYPNENPLGRTFRNGPRMLQIVGVVADSRYELQRTPFPPTFYRAYLQEPPGNIGTMTTKSVLRRAKRASSRLSAKRSRRSTASCRSSISARRTSRLPRRLAGTAVRGTHIRCSPRSRSCSHASASTASWRTRSLAAPTKSASARVGRRAPASPLDDPPRGGGPRGDRGRRGRRRSMGLTRYIQSMLFGVEPIDPATMGGAVVLMMLVALIAGWIPARRASRLEPMVALRHE